MALLEGRWYRAVMDDPDVWRWVWLLAAGGFAAGEMFTPGSFFLLPFAVGGLAAAIGGFAGASLAIQWVLFIAVTIIGAVALIPLRRRLDAKEPSDGIGARRLIGEAGEVLSHIGSGPTGVGEVQIGRESWRALSSDSSAINAGSTVRVVDVRGTAVVVVPAAPQSTSQGAP